MRTISESQTIGMKVDGKLVQFRVQTPSELYRAMDTYADLFAGVAIVGVYQGGNFVRKVTPEEEGLISQRRREYAKTQTALRASA